MSRYPADTRLDRLVRDLRMVTYTAAAGTGDAGKLDLLRVTGGRSAGWAR